MLLYAAPDLYLARKGGGSINRHNPHSRRMSCHRCAEDIEATTTESDKVKTDRSFSSCDY